MRSLPQPGQPALSTLQPTLDLPERLYARLGMFFTGNDFFQYGSLENPRRESETEPALLASRVTLDRVPLELRSMIYPLRAYSANILGSPRQSGGGRGWSKFSENSHPLRASEPQIGSAQDAAKSAAVQCFPPVILKRSTLRSEARHERGNPPEGIAVLQGFEA